MEVGCSKSSYNSSFLDEKMSCRPTVFMATVLHKKTRISTKWRTQDMVCMCVNGWSQRKCSMKKSRKGEGRLKMSKKEGTVIGAVSLIIGTSIGTGILALPHKTSPAGVFPSSVSLILCWAFLVIEALLLVEVNVGLLEKKNNLKKTNELEIISIRTMAQETLGEWGGVLSTITYVFLGYTSMIAYASKSAEILHRWIHLPESISGIFFTFIFTILVSLGGTPTTDQANQWLTATMICLLLSIEVVAITFKGWPVMLYDGDWGKVPATIPVMIFALVYHDIAPVICAYLGGDRIRIRTSILFGSIVPLVALLVWNVISLSLQDQVFDHATDPVQLLMRVKWDGMSFTVQAFSLLAVGTSMLGTLLGFTEFFKEQLSKILKFEALRQIPEKRSNSPYDLKDWWARKKMSFIATSMVTAPSLFVSTTFPDLFSAATDIAGGYCMTVLYGIIPPAMMWAWVYKNDEDSSNKLAKEARPALFCVGMVAGLVLVEQLLQDFSTLFS